MKAGARADADVAYARAVDALFARRPEVIIPGLRRVAALSRALGDPQHAYRCVHLTGTNGKTSTARIATALLVEAGVPVGTYTSPHLQDVRERIRVGGRPVSREGFLAALAAVEAQVSGVERALGEEVTFFETLTALGSVCFRDAGVDTAVVEVGMGGRWDATNVHDAAVAVIGRVGLDHPELGATHAEIAEEKAGITKDGATVVLAAQPPEAEAVVERVVAARGARLLRAGRDFGVATRMPVPGGQDLILSSAGRTLAVHLPLHGAHQAANAACALAAVDALLAERGEVLSARAARAGFARVRSPGRLEVFERPGQAPVVLDGAHNPEAAEMLARALDDAVRGRRVVAVVGVLADKDVAGVLAPLLERAAEVVLTRPPCPRAAPPGDLAAIAATYGRAVTLAPDCAAALAAADRLAGPQDAICVTGSLYLVGAARDVLGGALA